MNRAAQPFPKIVSGGQTGADRAALDWAINQGIPHGGWCPKGRRSEGGKIPARYQLQETATTDYETRTRQNVMDSDATVAFSILPDLTGGTSLTYNLAISYQKPLLHLHEGTTLPGRRLAAFIKQHRVKVLNVAGPRASNAPTVATFVANTLDKALAEFTLASPAAVPS